MKQLNKTVNTFTVKQNLFLLGPDKLLQLWCYIICEGYRIKNILYPSICWKVHHVTKIHQSLIDLEMWFSHLGDLRSRFFNSEFLYPSLCLNFCYLWKFHLIEFNIDTEIWFPRCNKALFFSLLGKFCMKYYRLWSLLSWNFWKKFVDLHWLIPPRPQNYHQ